MRNRGIIRGAFNNHNIFTPRLFAGYIRQHGFDRAACNFFEFFSQFARNNDPSLSEICLNVFQCAYDAMGRFIENNSAGFGFQRFEFRFPAFFQRQKSLEDKAIDRQAADNQSRKESARAGIGMIGMPAAIAC